MLFPMRIIYAKQSRSASDMDEWVSWQMLGRSDGLRVDLLRQLGTNSLLSDERTVEITYRRLLLH